MRWRPRRSRRVGGLLAALVLASAVVAGCSDDPQSQDFQGGQPQGASLRIEIGTQAFPEAKILGEMWRQALAVNGYTVDLQKDVGPAEDLDTLLQQGEIDGHVAYTGTVLSVVAGEDVTGLDPDATYQAAKKFYDGRNMTMTSMTPFENKDAVATTKAFAQENGLASIGDLESLPKVRFAARPEFEDLQLGLTGLRDTYGLDNLEFTGVPVGEQYAALDDGSADAVDAFTTDPQLESGDYTLLEDPDLLFGSQNVVMVVDSDKLERVGKDRFLAVIDAVNDSLTQPAMVDLNAQVTDGRSDETVARRYLSDAGLLEPLNQEGD